MHPFHGQNTHHKDTAVRLKGRVEGASFVPIMETYWSRIENVISMFMYVARVRVAVDNPAGGSFAYLPARPAEALMWQRQSLWSAGLTLWCCGRVAEPVSTNPISITLAASYLWLRWPSALPPSLKSSPLSCTLALILSPSFSLMSLYHPAPFLFPVLYPSFHFFRLFSLPPSILIGIPWQSLWCNIGSTPEKRRRQKWNRL